MSKPIRIELEAEIEITEAVAWYDEARMGLGDEYLTEVRQTIRSLATVGPECRPIQGVAAELGVRRKLAGGFRTWSSSSSCRPSSGCSPSPM